MNILAALSKLEQWPLVAADATATLGVIRELQDEADRQHVDPKDPELYSRVQARVFYFRGFARFRLGAFGAADADFKEAMRLAPQDEGIREDYGELQAAVQAEHKGAWTLAAASRDRGDGSNCWWKSSPAASERGCQAIPGSQVQTGH